MKHILLLVLASLGLSAQAAVVDTFNCSITLFKDDGTQSVSEVEPLVLVRKPDNVKANGGEHYTEGTTRVFHTVGGEGFEVTFGLHLGSWHVVTSANEAYNASCLVSSVTYCEEPACTQVPKGDYGKNWCSLSDPLKYGKRVAVENGVPMFGERTLYEEMTLDKWTDLSYKKIALKCTHQGTYY